MSDMKFVVLIWAVFQMFSFATSDTNSTTESHTLVNSKNIAKLGCNSRCGNLIVPYPFGVGDNSECYINEGFGIYCNTSVYPPKASVFEDSYCWIMMTTSVVNNSIFRGFFEKQKLTGPNFIDWYRQLRFLLSVEDKLNYLEHLIPAAPVPAQAEIQLDLENLSAYEILQELKTLFAQKADYGFLQTVQNFNMHGMGKTVNELHAMLKLHEQTQPNQNAHALYVIRNMKLSQRANSSGVFTIKLYTFPNKSWVYDTGYGTHICNTTQGLRGSRKLKSYALSLYVGNGQRTAIEAIGSYHLSLPSGLVIGLNNCHYAPSITRAIISVSRLYDDGYVNRFMDNKIQVSRNNIVYFSVVPRDGIFEIDLSDSYTNVSSMYALRNKRAKSNLNSALLWHCRLGHISKKCIEKLQHDGLLNSTNLRAFEKCVPCMSGKMARKPYTHQVE
ncbi:zinc finger, CCHC-type containing protein [Tanacetum coccineum]